MFVKMAKRQNLNIAMAASYTGCIIFANICHSIFHMEKMADFCRNALDKRGTHDTVLKVYRQIRSDAL